MKQNTQEQIYELAYNKWPEEIESIAGSKKFDINADRRNGFIEGFTEAQSDKEKYAQEKLEEYKRELQINIEENFQNVFYLVERIINEQMAAEQIDDLVKKSQLLQMHYIDLINSKQETKQTTPPSE